MESTVFIDQCPACKRTLKIDTAVSGPVSRCPACGTMLKVMAPPPAKKRRRRDQVSEEAMGVLALWICGVGAIVAIGSIVGVLAVSMSNKSAQSAGPPAVVPRFVPPPAQSSPPPPPSQRLADANQVAAPSWPTLNESTAEKPAPNEEEKSVAATPTPKPVERKPALPPAQKTSPPTPGPAATEPVLPVPVDLLARVAGVRADVFSHRESAGRDLVLWRPAPLGSHYVFFTLAVRNPSPDPTQLFFDSRSSSRAVTLTNASGESATMLGRLIPEAAPPREFDIRPLDLAGREEVSDLVVAFVVPTHWREATLDGPGFTTGRIRLPAPDDDPVSPDETIGWWHRTPEQPLRIRYVNPVMAALADPRVERMLITTDGRKGQANVSVPYADVAGIIEWPNSDTKSLTGAVDLRRGGARLTGNVRFTDQGRVMIVYASDDPFEQVIYRKKSA